MGSVTAPSSRKYCPSEACTWSSRSLQIRYARIAASTFGTSWSMSGSFCPNSQSAVSLRTW